VALSCLLCSHPRSSQKLTNFPGCRVFRLRKADPRLPLYQLQSFHNLDLTAPGGIDALAQAILEDWQRRQAMKP
jgi:hypothetical protein